MHKMLDLKGSTGPAASAIVDTDSLAVLVRAPTLTRVLILSPYPFLTLTLLTTIVGTNSLAVLVRAVAA